MKVAILGAGAMGTTLGAFLSRKNVPVDLIDSYEEHVKALNQNGAQVTGCENFVVPVHALTLDQIEDTYDLVFLLTKRTHNVECLTKLLSHLAEHGTVCTLQNGVPEPEVADIVGKERTVGGACRWGATFIRPGIVKLTSDLANREILFEIGEMDGKITDRLKMVSDILGNMGKAEMADNFIGARWLKLLLNSSMSGMSAALGTAYYRILENDKAMTCLAYLASEVYHVSVAAGVHMTETNGLNPKEIGDFKTPSELERSKGYLYRNYYPQRTGKASMLQDLERGVKTEVDMINGFVSATGRKCGVPTPFNDKVVSIIKDAENGVHPAEFSNLDLFEIPEI